MAQATTKDLTTLPVGRLGLIPLISCKDLGEKVNEWLIQWKPAAVQFSLPDSQVSSMQIKSFPDGKIKMSVHLQMSGSSMLSISARSWKRIPSEKQLPNRLHQTGLTISISDSTTLTNMKRNY